MPVDVRRLKELFGAAAELLASERAAFLERECGGDAELQHHVESLLQAHEASGSFLADLPKPQLTGEFTPAPNGEAATIPPHNGTSVYSPSIEPGTIIADRYTLVERIGEGGMGEVWVAKQTEPVRRKVAIKLIKAGMDSKAVLQRFEQERQALAMMDHPNIARVLDGGLTSHRQPYFVMELVNGFPLTKFCDQAKLTPRERLELFVPICQAVQHAHHKGIVHRDLKPANILVTLIDSKPVPKIIDFGVAKATGGKLIDESMDTQFGAVVGTLEYMSPEQAGRSSDDIDTRADIYSLGVVLYELLTGLRPFDSKRLKSAAIFEMIRVILEEEPSRPSTRLSTDEALPSLAAVRRTEPRRLTSMMRGELDWIVMKCLEKDRSRRYETANGLARDIERYLSDEPVEACPPSATYRLRKFAKKNRAALITTATIAALLVFGIAVSTWQAVRATTAEQAERLAKLDAEKAAAAEKQANEQSQKRLAQIAKGNEIITSIFADLDVKKVKEGFEPLEQVLAKRLVKAAEQLEGEAVGDPLVVATLQTQLGESLYNLGHYRESLPLHIKARDTRAAKLGPDHPDTLTSVSNLAVCYHCVGNRDLAVPLFEETLKLRKAKLGPEHRDTLESMAHLALAYQLAGKSDRALALDEEVLRLRKAKFGADDPATLNSMFNLATTYQSISKFDEAVQLLEDALKIKKAKLGPEHPDTIYGMTGLASLYQDVNRFDLAIPLHEQAFKLLRSKLGADHPYTLRTMHNLASGYLNSGKWELALPLHEECLKLRTAKFGPDHPDTFESVADLARCNLSAGKIEFDLTFFETMLAKLKAKLGTDHPQTLTNIHNLAVMYQAHGRFDKSVPLLEETLATQKAKLWPNHRETLCTMHNLAAAYNSIGQYAKSVPLFEDTLAKMQATKHPETLTCMTNLAVAYRESGQLDKALSIGEESLAKMKIQFDHDQPQTLAAMLNLAGTYRACGQLDKALSLSEEILLKRKSKLGPDHPETVSAMDHLAVVYLDRGQIAKAIPLLEESLTKKTAKRGADHPATLQTMSNLAEAYRANDQPAKAVPLIEETLKKTTKKLGADHPETLLCMNNLALVYQASGQLDKAVPLFEETLNKVKAKLGPAHPHTILSLNNLAVAYQESGQLDKALPLFEQAATEVEKLNFRHVNVQGIIPNNIRAYEAAQQHDRADEWRRKWLAFLKQDGKGESPVYAGELAAFGLSLLKQKKWTDAEPILRECLALREKMQPNVWTTFNTMSALGGALLEQKKYAEAEPLLIKGYEGMKQREKVIPKTGGAELRIPEAIQRLVQLYEALDKKDEAAKWKAEAEKLKEEKK